MIAFSTINKCHRECQVLQLAVDHDFGIGLGFWAASLSLLMCFCNAANVLVRRN